MGAAATSSRSRARSKSAEDNQQPQQTSSQLSSEVRSSLESDRGRSDDHKGRDLMSSTMKSQQSKQHLSHPK